jgi:hypothetical protein
VEPRGPASAITRTYFFLVVFFAVVFLAEEDDFFAAAFFVVAMVSITSFHVRKFTALKKTSQRFFVGHLTFSLDSPRAIFHRAARRTAFPRVFFTNT